MARAVWSLQRRQHGVLSREQLLGLGVHRRAVEGRLASGRLHRVHTGVYAVGRPELTRLGDLTAAVLACGEEALVSDGAAAELWRLRPQASRVEVTVPSRRKPRRPGIIVHRRDLGEGDATRRHEIPVTSPARTLLDIAPRLSLGDLERAINEADRLDLIDPERLRDRLAAFGGQTGVERLRETLDRRTFTLTDSELERRFKLIVSAAGLPPPSTQDWVNGYRVDFFWPDLGLVVETDGLRYHRTAAQQTSDLRRDQAHFAAGLLPLRFSHAQVFFEGGYVEGALRRAQARLAS